MNAPDTRAPSTRIAVVLADGEIDIIAPHALSLYAHVADLRELGHRVHVRLFDSWKAAEKFEDEYRT